ncbi:MAG TPA: hypothetical protein VM575_08030 [Nocardioides sp.]|nr:hypothetical protein [Nocardioides sp.]
MRRTLAAAGGPEPIPAGVSARLDGVIEDLVADRAASGATVSHPENPGIVVPLDAAARRRRVRVRALLGAAAAVVAVGVGAGIITNDTGGDGDGDAATATSDEAPARDGQAAGLADDRDQPGSDYLQSEQDSAKAVSPSAAPEASSADLKRVTVDEALRKVRPGHLREDLVALQHYSLPHPAAADYSRATLTAPADFMCEPTDFGSGYLVGVLYDGRPAVVAFREPVGSNQAAEVLACGTGDVLHSTILAAS